MIPVCVRFRVCLLYTSHLPGGRSIIIDAKAPMTAYLHAGETDRQEERSQWMSRHAADRCV